MTDAPGRPARTSTSSATRGASAGSASAGTASALIGHDGNTHRPGRVPAAPARGRASRSRCSPTAATPATSTRSSTARSSPSSPAWRCRGRSTPPAEPVDGRHHAVRRHATSARRCAMEVLSSDDGPVLRTTVTGPLAELVPEPIEEYPLVPGRRRPCSRSSRRRRETWTPVTFYELPTGERVRALRCPRHAEGATDWTSPSMLLADLRELVECESPSADLAAVARSADVVARVGTRRLGVAPERIVVDGRTHLRWRLGARPVAGAGARPPRHGLAARLARDAPVRGRRTACCAGPGCFDMKAGLVMAFHALGGPRRPRRRDAAGDRRRGARLAELARADRGRGRGCAGRARARGVGRRRRAQDRAQGRLAVRGRRRSAGPRTPASSPSAGVNATVELAHQVLAVAALGRPGARHHRDADGAAAPAPPRTPSRPRARSPSTSGCGRAPEQERVDAAMRALRAGAAGRRARGHRRAEPAAAGGGGVGRAVRPRAARSPHGSGCRSRPAAAVGGASDGNFTAGVGTPTLDGLGAVGGGAHADDEHVLVDALPGRTGLLARSSRTCWRSRRTCSRRLMRPTMTSPENLTAWTRDEPDAVGRTSTGGRRPPTRRRSPPASRCASSPTSPSSRTWCGCTRRSGAAPATRR